MSDTKTKPSAIRRRYWLESRLGGNRASRRDFRRDHAPLGAVQQEVVERMARDGVATVPFSELIDDADLWPRLEHEMAAYRAEVEADLPDDRGEATSKSDFLVRRRHKRLGLDDPLVRFGASQEVLGTVNAYRGLWTRLIEIDQWYTVPLPTATQRVKSQNWHRDPEDLHIVKVFVYFSDVDEEAGPFEYIPGSPAGGPFGDLFPWSPLAETYPPDELIRDRVPADAPTSLTGPPGTVVFCDTSGLHRGGFAKSKPRIMSKHTYVSPASVLSGLEQRTFKVKPKPGEGFSPAARFALS
jgi:Phytanoyl-CoA dioxygenase (PhyH)